MIPILANLGKRTEYVVDSPRYNRTQSLDIWQPESLASPAPVLVWIPGGAWAIGDRRFQGHGLMSHLCDQGWICVSVGYRTAPRHRWTTPFDDVSAAWYWTLGNIHEYGGGEAVAIAGASAGGHMASLVALTVDAPQAPDALVGLYGVYDWTSSDRRYALMNRYIERVVVGKPRSGNIDLYRDASPIYQVHKAAPATLIIHGDKDVLAPMSGAEKFSQALLRVSRSEVRFHPIAGGMHGFDLVNSGQANDAIMAISDFLDFHVAAEAA